jgi:hypothetical protein
MSENECDAEPTPLAPAGGILSGAVLRTRQLLGAAGCQKMNAMPNQHLLFLLGA